MDVINKKRVILNLNKVEDGRGSSELLFSLITRAINGKIITLTDVCKSINTFVLPSAYGERYGIIDKTIAVADYFRNREIVFPMDCLITDDWLASMTKTKAPLIVVAENSFLNIAKTLFDKNIFDVKQLYESGYFMDFLQRSSLERAKYIVAPSKYMEEQLLSMGIPESKIKLIQPGVDLDVWFQAGENKFDLRRDIGMEDAYKLVGVTVLPFHPRSGITKLHEIIKAHPDVEWIIITDYAGRKKLAKNVHVFTNPPLERMRELISIADFYINPVEQEAHSVYPLMAMGCNVPVLTLPSGNFYKISKLPEDYYEIEGKNNVGSGSTYEPTDWGIIIKKNDIQVWKDCITSIQLRHFEFAGRDAIKFYGFEYHNDFAVKWNSLMQDVEGGFDA